MKSKILGNHFELVRSDEGGFALILTVFIVALATMLVLDFSEQTLAYQRASRNYSERIQADFMLKSSLNLSRALLEFPKLDGIQEDWLGEPWALIAAAPSLPISGFIGEPRLMIVDEAGKINVNSIASTSPFGGLQQNPQFPTPGGTPGAVSREDFWKNSLRTLFVAAGFSRAQYSAEEFRTLGDQGYEAADQVAILHDWIDQDSTSHSSASFPGQGIESSANKAWFFNRPLRSISELAMVPGMTLDRIARVAPYIRVSRESSPRINVNTAPLEVLLAIGFPESQAIEIIQERQNLPINSELLRGLVAGDPQLTQITAVRSNEFSVYAQVRMPNVTRWARAIVSIQGGFGQRRAQITSIEFL